MSAERSSQSTQPRARCSPFGRGAWRQVAFCRGNLPRQRCRRYASAEGAPMCTLVLLIRSFPGPPQSTGARHRRARTLFGVKPAGGGGCVSGYRDTSLIRRNVLECSAVRGTRVPRSFRLAPFWRLNAAHLVNEENVFYARAPPRKRGRPGIKKHPRSSRGCAALAGAIGIEPTPWESEAHVLPLHQAPNDYNAGSCNLQSFSPTILTPPRAGTKLSV